MVIDQFSFAWCHVVNISAFTLTYLHRACYFKSVTVKQWLDLTSVVLLGGGPGCEPCQSSNGAYSKGEREREVLILQTFCHIHRRALSLGQDELGIKKIQKAEYELIKTRQISPTLSANAG